MRNISFPGICLNGYLEIYCSFTKHCTAVEMLKACYTSVVYLFLLVKCCEFTCEKLLAAGELPTLIEFFKKSHLHVYLMFIFSTFSSGVNLVLGCVGIMWLRRHEDGIKHMPGLSRKDGRSESTMYKSIIKRKKSLFS